MALRLRKNVLAGIKIIFSRGCRPGVFMCNLVLIYRNTEVSEARKVVFHRFFHNFC
jgi:hypothetical protein